MRKRNRTRGEKRDEREKREKREKKGRRVVPSQFRLKWSFSLATFSPVSAA